MCIWKRLEVWVKNEGCDVDETDDTGDADDTDESSECTRTRVQTKTPIAAPAKRAEIGDSGVRINGRHTA